MTVTVAHWQRHCDTQTAQGRIRANVPGERASAALSNGARAWPASPRAPRGDPSASSSGYSQVLAEDQARPRAWAPLRECCGRAFARHVSAQAYDCGDVARWSWCDELSSHGCGPFAPCLLVICGLSPDVRSRCPIPRWAAASSRCLSLLVLTARYSGYHSSSREGDAPLRQFPRAASRSAWSRCGIRASTRPVHSLATQ